MSEFDHIETKLSAARTRLILDKPFLGALVLRLPMVAADPNWCQSSGPIEVLVEQVEALGGTVNLVYENVPAVAISLPGGRLGALTEAPGVTWVEKDRLISLDDSSSNSKISPAGNYGRRSPAGASALKVNDSTGVKVKPIDPRTLLRQPSPLGYTNYLYTGAGDIWPETRYGKGSVVAVVDTGTVANHCLQYALTGAPGFPDGFNATEDGIPANSPENHWHGTFVGGVIPLSWVTRLLEG